MSNVTFLREETHAFIMWFQRLQIFVRLSWPVVKLCGNWVKMTFHQLSKDTHLLMSAIDTSPFANMPFKTTIYHSAQLLTQTTYSLRQWESVCRCLVIAYLRAITVLDKQPHDVCFYLWWKANSTNNIKRMQSMQGLNPVLRKSRKQWPWKEELDIMMKQKTMKKTFQMRLGWRLMIGHHHIRNTPFMDYHNVIHLQLTWIVFIFIKC